MKNQNEECPSRREFLHRAAFLSGAAAISGTTLFCNQVDSQNKKIWRLNPAFRIKEISIDEIELYTFYGNGQKLQYRFNHLEADFFRELEKEAEFDRIIASLSHKNGLQKKACKEALERSMQEFVRAGLIYSGDKMLVKISEEKNG